VNKPYSQACENNKQPIADVLALYLKNEGSVLEVGSGTGQHAVYMTEAFPQITWQTSDRIENHAGITAWVSDTESQNCLPPIALDVNNAHWDGGRFDFIFSANTVHIMSWDEVIKFFAFIPHALKSKGKFFLYGPFNYNGKFTSQSNAYFDASLKGHAPHMGIRDFEAVDELAKQSGLSLIDDHEMPANNRLLVWQLSAR